MDILIRSGFALLLALAGSALYVLWTRWQVRRVNRKGKILAGLEEHRAGVAAILYFTTPYCAPCKTQQRPALAELVEHYRDRLQVIQIDALEHPELADYWGVLSVPTTFIIDGGGRPRHVNHGVASAAKLRQQLCEFAGLTDANEKVARAGWRQIVNAIFHRQRSTDPCDEC